MTQTCKYCHQQHNSTPSHLKHCNQYRTWFDSIVTKEFLIGEYVVLGKSANEIAHALGLPSSTSINRAITRMGIDKRGISQSKVMPRAVAITENTNIKRYGVRHNLCKDHPSRIAWQRRMWENEGITNVFQRESTKDKIAEAIRVGIKSTWGSRISSPHRRVYRELVAIGIECMNEFRIPGTRFWYDIQIIGTNKIIEINGDFYHANPRKYKSTDVVVFPSRLSGHHHVAADLWDRDARKNGTASLHGYDVLVVWEYDIKNHFDQSMKTIINFIVGASGGNQENKKHQED